MSVTPAWVSQTFRPAPTEELEHVARSLPEEWLAPAATDTPAQCVATSRSQLGLGADAVILHGATPSELRPIVGKRDRRSALPFDAVRLGW